MNKELTIKCPKCEHVFSANEALQKHLKSKESEIEKDLKIKGSNLWAVSRQEKGRELSTSLVSRRFPREVRSPP